MRLESIKCHVPRKPNISVWRNRNRHTVLSFFFCWGGWLKPPKCENGMKIVHFIQVQIWMMCKISSIWFVLGIWVRLEDEFLVGLRPINQKNKLTAPTLQFWSYSLCFTKKSWGSQRGIVGDWLGHPSGWRPKKMPIYPMWAIYSNETAKKKAFIVVVLELVGNPPKNSNAKCPRNLN